MSQQSSRKSSITRSVLKEIINNQPTLPTSKRTQHSLETIQLNEAITFLERKVERQYKEIKLLSDQLSKEISLKEELAVLLAEEKDKNTKATQHLNNANKHNVELKKKITNLQNQDKGQLSIKESYEIKLNKYRDIVRKKDELLTKNQQKVQELLKNQKKSMDTDHQLRRLKDSFERLKHREQNLMQQLEALKKKNADLQNKISQKEALLQEQQQSLLFAEEAIRRLKAEYDELSQQTNQQLQNAKLTTQQLERVVAKQRQQIDQLYKARLLREKPEWSLSVFLNEMKRGLANTVKDGNLRKKVQKVVMDVMQEIQDSFNSILRQVIGA